MAEAVIVSTARSPPIGRAAKGSLKDVRPDELSRQMVEAALAKVPELDPADIEDIHWGYRPAGRSGRLQHRPRDRRRTRLRPHPPA